MPRVVDFKEGEYLIKAGSKEKVMYILMTGEVVVELIADGKPHEVSRMKKGDFFGEISFFSDAPRSADVRGLDEGRCVAIESLQQLYQFLNQNPKFAIKMVHILAQRLAKTDELLIGKIEDMKRVEAESKHVDWKSWGDK